MPAFYDLIDHLLSLMGHEVQCCGSHQKASRASSHHAPSDQHVKLMATLNAPPEHQQSTEQPHICREHLKKQVLMPRQAFQRLRGPIGNARHLVR